MTFDQQEPSAKSPCTKTTFFVFGDLWGTGDSIEQGKGGASGGSPDQCPAVHHSLRNGKIAPASPAMMLRFFMGIASLSTAKTIFWKRSGLLMSLRFGDFEGRSEVTL